MKVLLCFMCMIICVCYIGVSAGPVIPKNPATGCVCKEYTCGCCVDLEVPEISLNDSGCVEFSYLPKEYGINVELLIDNYAYINETISVKNPIPICIGVPEAEPFDICIRFYNLNVIKSRFHGCVRLELGMVYVIHLVHIELGCFDIGDMTKLRKYHQDLIEKARWGK